MKAPFAVIGNVNLDIKTSVIAASSGIMEDGETSVAEVYETLGGGGGAMAVAAACMGGQVHFCGCVGTDALGKRVNRALKAFGVTPHLAVKHGTTGRSINLIWNNHHRHFVSSVPNSRALEWEDINFSALTAAGCTHVYRIDAWFSEAMLEGGNLELFTQARRVGMETSLDIDWDPYAHAGADPTRLKQRREQLASVLPHTSWVHGNEHELGMFTGLTKIKDICRALTDQGCGGVIVHRGERGSGAYTSERVWMEVAPVPVSEVVCETGTGVVFGAAFLLHPELELDERLAQCGEIAAAYLEGQLNLAPRIDDRSRRHRRTRRGARRIGSLSNLYR